MYKINALRLLKYIVGTLLLVNLLGTASLLTVSAETYKGDTNAALTPNGNYAMILPRNSNDYNMYHSTKTDSSPPSNTNESSAGTESTMSLDQLMLNKINIKDLAKYIPVENITEDEFYQLNFELQIASIALSSDNDLLIRTVDNAYYTLKITERYINALELTGILEKGSSLRVANNGQPQPINSFGIVLVFMLLLTIGLYISWVVTHHNRQKAFETGITAEKTNRPTKSNPEHDEKKITFNEVQGIDELKPDLYRLVDMLQNPEKYKNLGARPNKGLVLYGPPGTGKTLIAKAISGEAGVPFFSASGSDFIEKYVGVGASRIRELFNKARKSAPCIIFIDEIDAIGGQRGEANNSERDQTINALLNELDGFSSSEGILTICATNRLDILDKALIRPGRFDLKIAVNLPDRRARYQILKLHCMGKRLGQEISIDAISKKTSGFSGAELENLMNEAALTAAVKNKDAISNDDVEDAFFKIIMNGHKKERSQDHSYTRLVAYHEAGHTLATKLLTNDGVPTVTIVQSTSGAGGVTFRAPEDTPLKSKKYLRNTVKVMYAGRAAEEILLENTDDITTGASQDIKQATEIIKEFIVNYGMGDNGMIDMTQLTNQFNIIEEASNMATELYSETLDLLTNCRGKLDGLALALLDKETLEEEEIDALIN